VREGVDVKLLLQEQELYVLAQSHARINKERAMRRRKLKWLWARLKQITVMEKLSREELLMKLGAARAKARAAWRLIDIEMAPEGATFSFALNRDKLRQARRREGRYLLRTNLSAEDPAKLWQFYIQLVEVEAAFKNLKDDLQLRPILEHRIEAHILVCSSDCSWFVRVAGGRRYDLRRLGIRAAASSDDICSSRHAVVPAMSFAA
jgi:hypothetical protein